MAELKAGSNGHYQKSPDYALLSEESTVFQETTGYLNQHDGVPFEVLREWEFTGWGQQSMLTPLRDSLFSPHLAKQPKWKMGSLAATALSGNTVASACLYVTGVCIMQAGRYAPFAVLLAVASMLLIRRIYTEVGSALPLNGGSFTALVHSTSKRFAALLSSFILLAYLTQAIVHSSWSSEYLSMLSSVSAAGGFAAVLLGCMAVCLAGLRCAGLVASAVFVLHCATMAILTVCSVVRLSRVGWAQLSANWSQPEVVQPDWLFSLFHGFSIAMVGFTGFETCAQYIQEQKAGVYVKTLRNLWWILAILNPLMSFLCLCLVDSSVFTFNPTQQKFALVQLANAYGGEWLPRLFKVDAFLVLAASVLSAFVGASGLVRRMSADRCVPQALAAHPARFVVAFAAAALAIYFALDGNVLHVSHVHSLCFLAVLLTITLGDMMIKYKRDRLPRAVRCSWPELLLAFALGCVAVAGAVVRNTLSLEQTLFYFLVCASLLLLYSFKLPLLKLLLRLNRYAVKRCPCLEKGLRSWQRSLRQRLADINASPVVFFSSTDDLSIINKAVLYVKNNEDCSWIRIVHVYRLESEIPPKLVDNVAVLDRMYPKQRVDVLMVPGVFGPDIIEALAHHFQISKNRMFIACPNEHFPHQIDSLGGVRLITH